MRRWEQRDAKSNTPTQSDVKGMISWSSGFECFAFWVSAVGGDRPIKSSPRTRIENPHGENGAGKTILVEAIDLLIGGRASADLVRTGEESATIQAVFERADGREVIVRREISAQGRSRAFIDDALATSAALKEIGRELVDLHGQHEHQTRLVLPSQLTHLDAFLTQR